MANFNPPGSQSADCYLEYITSFFDLQTYAPCLASTTASWMTRMELGHMHHPYLFLSLSVPPAQLVDSIGPWLHETKQGLWPQQLPLAKHTVCIGWLLYSTPEYNLGKLHQQLKLISGIDVALCFCSIHDGIMEKTTNQSKTLYQSNPHGGWDAHVPATEEMHRPYLCTICTNISIRNKNVPRAQNWWPDKPRDPCQSGAVTSTPSSFLGLYRDHADPRRRTRP